MAKDTNRSRAGDGSRAERVVGDLARRGELRARDLQNLAKTVLERAERSGSEFTRLIQKEIRRQIKALGLATRDDLDALNKRIAKLERKPRAKRTTAKKT